MTKRSIAILAAILAVVGTVAIVSFSVNKNVEVSASNTVRIGYSPNVSHAQAVAGVLLYTSKV